MYKIKKGLKILDIFSNQKWIKYFGKLSFYLGFPLLLGSAFLVIYGIIQLKAMFAPLIPGTEIHGVYIPILPTLIAIFIVALIHEFSHGILARYFKIKIKSWGFFFLGPFLGAFVEPDEEEIKKLEWKKQISIYNAGPISNILTALIFFLILSYIISPIYSSTFLYTNVTIIGVENNSAAYLAGVKPNETILKLDNITIHSIYDIKKVLENKRPGESITLVTNKGSYILTLKDKEGRAYMGVYLKQNYKILNRPLFDVLYFLVDLFNWLIFISIGIAIANMLPIYPLDGGRTLFTILQRYFKEKAQKIMNYINILFILLLLINISLNFI